MADDQSELKKKIKAKGYSFAGYARANGFNVESFKQWLRGQWTSKNGKVAKGYMDAMRRDGIIEEKTAA